MIELAALGGSTVVAAGAAFAGWLLGRRRGLQEGSSSAAAQTAALGAQRDAAERRAREAQSESQRWRKLSLAATGLSREPLFAGRTAPRDAEELANLIRGLVLVDDVVIADASGLPLTREVDGRSAGLAALGGTAAALIRQLAGAAVPVVQVSIETFTAEHVSVRPLSGRGEGALLVVQTTSQPVNPLALDAVAHAAARQASDLPGPTAVLALRGATETESSEAATNAELLREVEQQVHGELTGIVVTSDGRPVLSVTKNGPRASVRGRVTSELVSFQRRASLVLRNEPIARVEAVLADGSRLGWAALAPSSRLALVTFGRADARLLANLAGRLRRTMNDRERIVRTAPTPQETAA